METILRKAQLFDFLFGMFNFDNEEIDREILNYDYVNMELRNFGTRVYLNPDLVSQATKIPHIWEDSFSYWKTPKLEKNHMANKICGKILSIPRNGLRMQAIPPGIYKSLIQIVLSTILNHHRKDISGECMRVVINWVEDRPIDIPQLLGKKCIVPFKRAN